MTIQYTIYAMHQAQTDLSVQEMKFAFQINLLLSSDTIFS